MTDSWSRVHVVDSLLLCKGTVVSLKVLVANSCVDVCAGTPKHDATYEADSR